MAVIFPKSLGGGCKIIKGSNPMEENFRSCRALTMQKCNKTSSCSDVTKSSNDTRDYRAFSLPNGLRALVIADLKSLSDGSQIDVDEDDGSDAESLPRDSGEEESMDESSEHSDSDNKEDEEEERGRDKISSKTKATVEKLSAASLCIGCGSFSDPDDIPGLAHFLEHMVFMGSQKYTNENHFDAFVKAHGGSSNAYTDCERTVFYFDVRKKYFREALDIFAQFFVSPLLKQNSVDREIKAVDSEFDMSKASDQTRSEQLHGSLARDNHPMGKFMMGSIDSLKTIPESEGISLYDNLKTFHQKHYSAHYMTLAIQSRDNLDQLEDWITEIFSDIPNNGLPKDCFKDLYDPFNTERFFKLYKVIPVKNHNVLELTWALPSQLDHYRVKPLHYLGWLVGHEGKGSILSYLKTRYWATGLDGGNGETGFEHNSTCAVFTVSVTLTDAGLDSYQEVIAVIFEYLTMLRKSGAQKRIYNEIQQIEANGFRWQEQGDPVDYVDNVCVNMQLYPPEHYLTGDELLFHYDAKIIEECQNYLRPNKVNICLTSKRFEESGECTLREKWYQTAYCVEDIPKVCLERWGYIVPREEIFHLPAANDYIATDFSIKESEVFTTVYPVAIIDTDAGKLWFKKDCKFKVPKARLYFKLVTNLINQSPATRCLMDLFLKSLDHHLSEVAYAADVAQLSYSLCVTEKAMIIKVSGFNHKLAKLFQTIVEHIVNFELKEELFTSIKEQLEKTYYNECIKPATLNRDVRLQILQDQYWTVTDKKQHLPHLTRASLLRFVEELKSQLYIEGLIQGNITEQGAKKLYHLLLEELQCRPLAKNLGGDLRVISIPIGESYCRTANFNQTDSNSVITNYYQYGPATLRQRCLNELLFSLIEEPCFDILRTREQLGYEVYSKNRVTAGILALSVTVCSQADKFSMDQLNDRIEAFLIEFEGRLNTMSMEDFTTTRDSLIGLKQCEDTCLSEEIRRNWNELESEHYCFDRLVKEVAILRTLGKEDIVDWYKRYTLGSGRCRKLSVQVVGHTSDGVNQSTADNSHRLSKEAEHRVMMPTFLPVDTPFPEKVITDPVAFRNSQTLHPVSKITE